MKRLLLVIWCLSASTVVGQSLSLNQLRGFVHMNLTEINSVLTNSKWELVENNNQEKDKKAFFMVWQYLDVKYNFRDVIKILKSQSYPNQIYYEISNAERARLVLDHIKDVSTFIKEELEFGQISSYYKDNKFAYRLSFSSKGTEIDVFDLKDFLSMQELIKKENK